MQLSIRHAAIAMLMTAAFMAGGTRAIEGAETASLQDVTYFNGSSWLSMKTMNGTFEGPAGGDSPTARMKSQLGGPKTYFILAGAASEIVIGAPRPRFRFAADGATAARVQLAQFEAQDDSRRTTIEVGKVTTFKKGSDLDVTRVSEGVYEVRPKKSLQPGQYALVTTEQDVVADFAIVDSGY